MNRVLCYLGCDCERRRRTQAAAQEAADGIRNLAGDIIEVTCRPLSDDDERLHFWLTLEVEPTGDYDRAAAHLAAELRLIADNCTVVAERLEGGAA